MPAPAARVVQMPLAVSVAQLVTQLRALGVRSGSLLVVHAAFSRVGPVEGGPDGLILALVETLGHEGTLVMPSMADDDDTAFNPAESSCRGMGVVADTFWRRPGVLRSDSPHAFAARGPLAARITADHPVDVPHGPDSPAGRVYQLVGDVLLLGVGHDANTTVHVAETIAGVRYGCAHHATILKDGRPERVDYFEVDHCCQQFTVLDEALDAGRRQRRGTVGRAAARLVSSRDVVEAALDMIRRDETTFLHPSGACVECDLARTGMLRIVGVRAEP